MTFASGFGLVCLLGLSAGCSSSRPPEQLPLPPEVVALYGEAAAYNTAADVKRAVSLDLASLIKDAKVEAAVVVPFDDEHWYEPQRVPLNGTQISVEVEAKRDLLVALDLGEIARNNYQVLSQMAALRGILPAGLRPRLCTQILCAADSFRAPTLTERVPDLKTLPIDFGRVLADVSIGSAGRPGTICEQCLEPPGNVLPCLVWKCGPHPKFPVARKLHVRRNVYTITPAAMNSYRAGVAAMKARPDTDPTSWVYQAKMHALNAGTAAALQDQCQHRQFFFFSWHRMYTYYFERILRKASGDPSLTLPYWNYTDDPAQAVLPDAFRTPANTSNALYDGSRSAAYNGGAGLPAADVSYTSGFNLINFTTPTLGSPSFGGQTVSAPAHFPSSAGSGGVERSPHNNVHNDISGNMAAGESPLDPIFWLHHANIDRLWKRWLVLGAGRENPTADSAWMSQTFTFFDENGGQVSLTGAQILDTVDQLGYRYDDDPLILWPVFWPYAIIESREFTEQKVTPPQVLAETKRSVRLTDARQDVAVTLPPAARNELARLRSAPAANERYILQLRNIQYDGPVGITYMLFLNLPADAKNPDHTHPNFIGTLGFFGGHHGASDAGLQEDYDVTAVVQRMGAVGELKLTIVPSYPRVPPDRKDLEAVVAKMKPQGNPRFGEIALVRQRVE